MSYKIDLSYWKKVCELDNFIMFKYIGFLLNGNIEEIPFLELFEVMKRKKFTLRCIFDKEFFVFERVSK